MKRFCQACTREIPINVERCPHCGTLQSLSGISIRRQDSGTSWKRSAILLLCGLVGGGAVIGLVWYYKVKPRLEGLGVITPDSKSLRETVDIEDQTAESFDKRVTLPTEPMGIAFGRDEYILGNRKDPWGLVRMKPSKDKTSFELNTVPVHESNYKQKVSFNTITWNGQHYVTVTDGAWFNAPSKNVFCKHDPVSLEILSTTEAPDQIGCLAFDGTDYWGATRSNTVDSGEPVFLYRFDSALREISRHDAPGKGCQGLAWDGQFLWFADVFDDSIHVLDISEGSPKGVDRISAQLDYLSGVTFDGRDIWVSEYGNHQIHRLRPEIRRRIARLSGRTDQSIESVSSVYSEPKLKDTYNAISPEYPEDNTDVHEFSAEISNGILYGSWKIHYGEKLFESNTPSESAFSMPTFARYTVTVNGPGGAKLNEIKYDAQPGMNEMSSVQLANASDPGEYDISIFIHVQYVREDGVNQILNNSAPSLSLKTE
jgi:hypothetical protein